MTTHVLLTLGRMPKGLDLARGFAAAGCDVYVADPHANHISRYSNSVKECFTVTAPNDSADDFVDDLLNIVKDKAIDIVVPISEESVYTAKLKVRLPEHVIFFGPGFDVARRLHDKYEFNRYLVELNLPAPETALLGTDEANELVQQHDVIVKPIHASAGIDIITVNQGDSLPSATNRPSLVQQQLRGRLLTSLSVAKDGQCLQTGIYEGRIFTGSVAIAFERVNDAEVVQEFAKRFIEDSHYTGFISFDVFIENDNNAYAIECNPRLTSGIHLFNTTDVARAIMSEAVHPEIALRERLSFQHFWPALGTTEMSLIKGGPFKHNLKHFLKSSDVTWSRHDIKPFLMMNFCSGEILKKYFFDKMSLGEASITDIEWRE